MSKTLDPARASAVFAAASDVERDAPTLRDVFNQNIDFVWRLARALGLPPDDADDVAQEVFLVVHRRLSAFEVGRSMRAWLFGITRNVVLQHQRTHTRRERRRSAVPPPQPGHGPDVAFALQQAADLMQVFLDQLDVDKRIVFLLADIEGLTAPEIAEALALPLGTVFSRLRAARIKLETFSRRLDQPEQQEIACATNKPR